MALSNEQVLWTARIIRESYQAVVTALAARSLTGAELILANDLIAADIDEWQLIENSFIKYKGGGVDFDNERKRQAIFYRLRHMLGFPFVVYDLNAPILELIELEVGQNFS